MIWITLWWQYCLSHPIYVSFILCTSVAEINVIPQSIKCNNYRNMLHQSGTITGMCLLGLFRRGNHASKQTISWCRHCTSSVVLCAELWFIAFNISATVHRVEGTVIGDWVRNGATKRIWRITVLWGEFGRGSSSTRAGSHRIWHRIMSVILPSFVNISAKINVLTFYNIGTHYCNIAIFYSTIIFIYIKIHRCNGYCYCWIVTLRPVFIKIIWNFVILSTKIY